MNKKRDLMYTWMFMFILVITAIYDRLENGGVKSFRIVLVACTIWLAYFIYKKTFFRKCSVLYYLVLLFIFASMYLASVWDFYGIPNYDKYLHLISGVIVGVVGYVVYLHLFDVTNNNIKPITAVIFVIIFSISGAAIWEMWECATDSIFGFNAQNGSLIDTMLDIYCGSIVGIITSVPIYLHSRGRNIKVIKYILDEMNPDK